MANYINDQSTVTVDFMSWAFDYAPGATGYLPMCGWGGTGSCPYRAPPGSDFTGSILVSGYYSGQTAQLTAPSPFRLVSTNPSVPVLVPASGVLITVVVQLPTSAGEYSFTGNVTFT